MWTYGMVTSAVSKKVGYLSSPLTKGGLRGVVRSRDNLPQPLLGKEGGNTSSDLYRAGTKFGLESTA